MQQADELTTLFRTQGLRVTPQRQAIFRLLHQNDRHPTVESLYDAARTEMPTISLKTVYQTVHDLEALGQVSLLDLGTGSVRVDPNVEGEHHHLVCSSCGLVRDVPMAEVPALPARYRREFRTDAVEVIFRGVCEQCASSAAEHPSS
jgi:Fe2+ or Zn2+ uptake regulation protein